MRKIGIIVVIIITAGIIGGGFTVLTAIADSEKIQDNNHQKKIDIQSEWTLSEAMDKMNCPYENTVKNSDGTWSCT